MHYPAVLRRPLVAGLLLLAAYVALSFGNDTRGYLSNDTGGKVATLKVMAEHHTLDPDVGYWAAAHDPTGRFHPLFHTNRYGDRWVNVTTLPALYLAYPLYDLGGYRLALLVPMIGAVAAAFAARALARRLGASDDWQWAAFWLAGLASPLTVFALDFWEHSIGVALMGWAVVLALDVMNSRHERPHPVLRALGVGLLFGTAATMRTEALVYAAVTTAVIGVVLLFRTPWRKWFGPALAGLAIVGGVVAPIVANSVLERAALGASLRTSRATSTAVAATRATDVTESPGRTKEAVEMAVALAPGADRDTFLRGFALLVLLAIGTAAARKRELRRVAAVALIGVVGLYASRFHQGSGFVSGLVAANPLVVVGLVLGWATGRVGRVVLVIALVALPIVWATDYAGGAGAQWGARYILTSGLLLAAVGAVNLPRTARWFRAGIVAVAVSVTAFGVGSLWIRARAFDHAAARLDAVPSDVVVISRLADFYRSSAAIYGQHRWLTATHGSDLEPAVRIAEAEGVRRVDVVDLQQGAPSPTFAGWRETGTRRVRLLGFTITANRYELDR